MTEEMPHVRCIECGKVLANKWDRYQELLGAGVKPEDALTAVGLTRYCCRMWMQSPFKIPIRSARQINPLDPELQEQRATLNVIEPRHQATLAPLQAMQNPTTVVQIQPLNQMTQPLNQMIQVQPTTQAYTVVPLTDGTQIGLPAIPEVTLPGLPGLPGLPESTKKEKKAITRIYSAW